MGDHTILLDSNSCLSSCYVWSSMGQLKDALGLTEACACMPADQGRAEGCGAAARRSLLVVHGAGAEAHGHCVAAHRQSGAIPGNKSHRACRAQGAHQNTHNVDVVSLRIYNRVRCKRATGHVGHRGCEDVSPTCVCLHMTASLWALRCGLHKSWSCLEMAMLADWIWHAGSARYVRRSAWQTC